MDTDGGILVKDLVGLKAVDPGWLGCVFDNSGAPDVMVLDTGD